MTDTAQPLVLPRGLIFLASLWLIGSWMITIGVRTPIQPVSASYTPGVQMMLFCLSVGLLVGWPLLRLSQRATAHPIGQTVLDLVVLLSLVQVVIWPLRLVTPWTVRHTAAIDATVSLWTVLAGAVVASSIGTSRRGPRSLAMLACLAMCLVPPVLAWQMPSDGTVLWEITPLLAVYALGEPSGAPVETDRWRMIVALAAGVVVVWLALAAAAWWSRRRRRGAAARAG